MSRYKRRFLVDKRYQLGEIWLLAAANVLAVLLTAALLSWFFLLVWDDSLVVNYSVRIPVYIGILALVAVLIAVFLSLHRSRSVAGMVVKMLDIFDAASRGDVVPDVRFRQTDPFQKLADPLNRCLRQIEQAQEQRKKDQRVFGLIRGLLKQLNGEEDYRKDIKEQIEDIMEMQK